MKLYGLPFVILLILSPIVSAQITGLSGWDICIDPGHSRYENMGVYGYSEAERNVRVALRLSEMLLEETDIDTVYLTRINDTQSVSLSQRTTYANSIGATWYHSIHSDAGSAQANSTLLLWGQYSNGLEKIPNGGHAMADIMINNLTNGMRTYTVYGSIGDCSFYGCSGTGPYLHVNRESNMPSELSESGFHTNPRQNQIFMNADWKRLEARTFFWSILDYHLIPRPKVRIITGIVTNGESARPLNGTNIKVEGQEYVTDTYESLFYKYSSDPDLLRNGFYYFEDISGDSVEIITAAEGYYTDTSRVKMADNFFTFQDIGLISKIPPRLLSTIPTNNDTSFSILEDISFVFSRPMNRSSVQENLDISPAIPVSYKWSNNDSELSLKTDLLEFNTDYTITLSGEARDNYDHPFDGNGDGTGGDNFVLNFKTGSDYYPPQLEAIFPGVNAKIIDLNPIINLHYDEELDVASVKPEIFKLEYFADKSAVPGQLKYYAVNGKGILSFFPEQDLKTDQLYVSRIYPGLKDRYGNTIEVISSTPFQTGTQSGIRTLIDDFESDLLSNWWQPTQSGSTTGYDPVPGIYRDENLEIVSLLNAGIKSMEVFYNWDTTAQSWLLREYLSQGSPRNAVFDTTFILQVYMFGDGSNNQFRFCVDEGDGISWPSLEVSTWYTIDWYGWKLIEWKMSDPATVGSWIGNGKLDGNSYRIDSFQLTYQPGAEKMGIIYFDDLQLIKKTEVDHVISSDNKTPDKFNIYQNYPNPFNPITIIRFSLSNPGYTTLSVYNTLGEIVAVLVNKQMSAGEHLVEFDGKNFATGTYIYRLQSGEDVLSKKMILIR